MPLDSKDFESIYAAMEKRITKQGEYFLTSKVVKRDDLKKLVWVSELGDQPIPIFDFEKVIKYYDTQVNQPVVVASGTAVTEMGYAENTTGLNVTATTEAGAQTFVTAPSISFDGSTVIEVEGFWYAWEGPAVANADIRCDLFADGSFVTQIAALRQNTSTTQQFIGPCLAKRRLTPSAGSHTYSLRFHMSAAGTGVVFAGTGSGAGSSPPGYIKISRVVPSVSLSVSVTTTSNVIEKIARMDQKIPDVGDTVLVALERGTRRLPRCLGKVQSRDWIATTLDEA